MGSPQILRPRDHHSRAAQEIPDGGTLTFEHTFPETGKFIGIVTVTNEHGQKYVSQFPFSVGKGFGNSIGIYASMVAVLFAAVYLIWRLGAKQKLISPSKPA